ncbi:MULTISPECIES: hypothetical protein [Meiothermus]|uniref:hypothetical protein n=1 Tax=Meiothermus TaxID=65551 RepID=UPI00048093E9|nr:hypothetical protein [Meiothermus sp.]
MTFSMRELIAEVDRELALRRNVYRQRVRAGKMHRHDAEAQYLRMVAIRRLLTNQADTAIEVPDEAEIIAGLYGAA